MTNNIKINSIKKCFENKKTTFCMHGDCNSSTIY